MQRAPAEVLSLVLSAAVGCLPDLVRILSAYPPDLLPALLSSTASIKTPDDYFYEGTALHAAAIYGHPDIIKCLLNAGADVDPQGRFEQSTLHSAAARGRPLTSHNS